ncbi:MAG: 50S ribosomal protein L6 [Candidatus Hodarchaeota archaeon]
MVKYANVIKEITFPLDEGVKFKLDGKKLEVNGPKGKVTRDFTHARNLSIELSGKDKVILEVKFPRKKDLSIIGTVEGHIKNMILGVTKGFKYVMKIVYAHFPITVKVDKNNNNVEIQNFIGERGFRVVPIMGDVKISATKEDVIIEGVDKELIGQNAANIQLKTKIADKDLRIFQDGIYVYEKWAGDDRYWQVKT